VSCVSGSVAARFVSVSGSCAFAVRVCFCASLVRPVAAYAAPNGLQRQTIVRRGMGVPSFAQELPQHRVLFLHPYRLHRLVPSPRHVMRGSVAHGGVPKPLADVAVDG
jgi:hypothetical protein